MTMKKMLFCLLSLCFGLMAFAQENLLENGGFEDGIPAVVTGQKNTQGKWLAYYQAQRGGIETSECEGFKGKGLKVTVNKCEKPVWDNYIYQNLSLEPGQYEITFYAKASKNAAERTSLRVMIKPSTAPYLGDFKSPWSPKKKVTTEWQQFTQKFTITDDQEGVDNARFLITLEEPDIDFFIDEVTLTKIK